MEAETHHHRYEEQKKEAANWDDSTKMLPSLNIQSEYDSKKKKSKKERKKKKREKKHKHKKKQKDKSSDSSEQSEGEEWIEKDSELGAVSSCPPSQRDEWMMLPTLFPCVNRDQLRAHKRKEPTKEEEEMLKKKFLLDNPGQSERELNPYWKDGGKGLPQVQEPSPEMLSLPSNSAGDHGVAWLRRALQRVQEQAKEEGRSEDAVAAERWGSLEKLKSMLSEAENRCRIFRSNKRKYCGGNRGRIQGPRTRPKDYEDWGQDPTAGELTLNQSEEVGDKSRYRTWLGLDVQSSRQESVLIEDDSRSVDDGDDLPVVDDTGMILKDYEENKKKLERNSEESDTDNVDELSDKIVFRPMSRRIGREVKNSTYGGKARTLRETVSVKNINKVTELLSDDDDKLFEEWRNERKDKDSSSDENEARGKISEQTVQSQGDRRQCKMVAPSESSEGDKEKNRWRKNIDITIKEKSIGKKWKGNEGRYHSKDINERNKYVSDPMETKSNECEDKELKQTFGGKYDVKDDRINRIKESGIAEERREEKHGDKQYGYYGNRSSKVIEREILHFNKSLSKNCENSEFCQKRERSKSNNSELIQVRGEPLRSRKEVRPISNIGSEYLRKPKIPDPFQRGRSAVFRKPDDDISYTKSANHEILSGIKSSSFSSGSRHWLKKESQKPVGKSIQNVNASISPVDEGSAQTTPTVCEEENTQSIIEMSDEEMNILGAKVAKAEMMGNHTVAVKLRAQLAEAQTSRQQRRVPCVREKETLILTHRDSRGFVRPMSAPLHPPLHTNRQTRSTTHGADGLRERFYPDDDRYTLESMFQKEKMTTIEDVNRELFQSVSKGACHSKSDYDLDDIFADNISTEKTSRKLEILERRRAIREHHTTERSLDSCLYCFESSQMLKHLVIALGSKVYLSLPAHQSLTDGHCLLSPIHHVPCATQLDEDVWEEMVSFRKALVAMFSKNDQDCIFFESSMRLRRFPHMIVECVPLPKEICVEAPIYFKKAIMESETEWSMNKKLVDLKGKGVRRAVPKGLPYFAVDFGLEDGFAHVIENEKLFPENFAQEIIGGMLDLDHSLWRKRRPEHFDTQRKKVSHFAEIWKEFDITKNGETIQH